MKVNLYYMILLASYFYKAKMAAAKAPTTGMAARAAPPVSEARATEPVVVVEAVAEASDEPDVEAELESESESAVDSESAAGVTPVAGPSQCPRNTEQVSQY